MTEVGSVASKWEFSTRSPESSSDIVKSMKEVPLQSYLWLFLLPTTLDRHIRTNAKQNRVSGGYILK